MYVNMKMMNIGTLNINMSMNGNENVNVYANVMGSDFACFELATRAGDGHT